MIFDWLIIFLIWFILIILLISIIFYNRLRVRDYYFSNETNGDVITFTPKGEYHSIAIGTNKLAFQPLYSDRNRSISGGLVILTHATKEEYYRIKVMDGSTQLSEGIYRIDPKLCYNKINFSAHKGEDRQITMEFQVVDNKTGKPKSEKPKDIRLVKASAYYY